jgi:hypothetical protein
MNEALVRPERVAEIGVSDARDSAGRCRHPALLYRARPELPRGDVALFGSLGQPTASGSSRGTIVHAHVDTLLGRRSGAPDER